MESNNWFIQVEKEGKVLRIRGKNYFEKEGTFQEVMMAAREYMLNEKEKRDEKFNN